MTGQPSERSSFSERSPNCRGSALTPKAFADLGNRAVDQALSRLTKAGKIRRISRGVYDVRKNHPTLGPLSPDPRCSREGYRGSVRLSPATDAGAGGERACLSSQVPAPQSRRGKTVSKLFALELGSALSEKQVPKLLKPLAVWRVRRSLEAVGLRPPRQAYRLVLEPHPRCVVLYCAWNELWRAKWTA